MTLSRALAKSGSQVARRLRLWEILLAQSVCALSIWSFLSSYRGSYRGFYHTQVYDLSPVWVLPAAALFGACVGACALQFGDLKHPVRARFHWTLHAALASAGAAACCSLWFLAGPGDADWMAYPYAVALVLSAVGVWVGRTSGAWRWLPPASLGLQFAAIGYLLAVWYAQFHR